MFRIILIVLLSIALIWVLFYLFGNKGDKTPESNGCPSSFTIHPYGQIIQNAVAITYSTSNGKYYMQDAAGFAGYSAGLAPKEITQEVFMAACKKYQGGGQ